MKKKRSLHSIYLPLAAILFLGSIIFARAQQPFTPDPLWIPPTADGLGAPITPLLDQTQIKAGGLWINNNLGTAGIRIFGDPSQGKGKFILDTAPNSNITQAQEEQISLFGNLNIDGLIKPNGAVGVPHQILLRGDDAGGEDIMTWGDRSTWITITGGYVHDITCQGALPPGRCEDYTLENGAPGGYIEFEYHCLSQDFPPGSGLGYSAYARICKKTF
jgi:hypothetical protein